MMLNVMFISTNLFGGGAQIMLLKLLGKLDRSKIQPVVVSLMDMGDVGVKIKELGIEVYTFEMQSGKLNPKEFFRLVTLIRDKKPDVVDTWMYHADLLGGLAARMAGCRGVVWGLHNSDLSRSGSKRSTRLIVRLCALLSGYLPFEILSCSRRARTIHEKLGYKKNKFRVIPNGFDLHEFSPNIDHRLEIRSELDLPSESLLVGLMARFHPQKNHLGFLAACKKILSKIPDVYFVLAGAGVDYDNRVLSAAVDELMIWDNIRLLGQRRDMPKLMSALDVLVSASGFGEAFPIVIGEAMACGVPCVVTDAGDSAEMVGDTGRSVGIGDMDKLAGEVVELLQLTGDERKELGLRARERVSENYELGHIARQYESVYERVAAETGRRVI